jgi:CO dehydrogenase/acetyl-CoA synthase beta subunit
VPVMYLPEEDGITHINVYSKGKTPLGRALSNWTPLASGKYIQTAHGPFLTIEGYWAWLGYINPPDSLRTATGWRAKQFILRRPEVIRPHFEELIKDALWDKCEGLEDPIRKSFLENELPLAHYYVYGGRVRDAGFVWILDELRLIQTEMRQED